MRFQSIFLIAVTCCLLSTPVRAAIDDKSLVLYLSFNEGEGKVAKDGTKYGHDAELVKGPKWVDGKVGKALEFKGAESQYAMVPITDTLQTTKTLSIAFWVKRGPTKDQIRDWNYMIGGGSLKWHVIFKKGGEKTYVWTKSGGAWAQKGISDDIQPEDWVHIAVTHDTKANVSIYFDGKKAGGGPKPPVIDEIDGSFMVGARHPGEEFFTGVIDEVYLFNRVIKPDEIKAVMEDTLLPVQPGGKLATTWARIRFH
ncbi:MAG: LamG domain-containing protein [Candidatus Poribacteria bacterium]|nr:LamG domain-containing protein [Candidatus Poribacteria bacterium]